MTETFSSFSDALWAPLREALPSFAARWRAFTSRPNYDPLDGPQNITEFESHLGDFEDADLDSLGPLFVVMERLYTDWHPEMHEVLTIKVLENLTHAADERGIDLRRLARLLPGPRTRDAWRQALMWTHRECTWDDEHWIVPGSWFDVGDEREIIEQLPPELDRLMGDDPAAAPPAG